MQPTRGDFICLFNYTANRVKKRVLSRDGTYRGLWPETHALVGRSGGRGAGLRIKRPGVRIPQGAPYRTKMGTTGRKRSAYLNSIKVPYMNSSDCRNACGMLR